MNKLKNNQLMLIGEFSLATQLSPKALRIYDDQGIISPAHTDTSNGYRYYRIDQVHEGRLIRILREMHLPLAEISKIIRVNNSDAQYLLNQIARQQENRYAKQRAALHSVLLFLNKTDKTEMLDINEFTALPGLYAVKKFTSSSNQLLKDWQKQKHLCINLLLQMGVNITGEIACRLIEPLSEEVGDLEIVVPIPSISNHSQELVKQEMTLSESPRAQCIITSATDCHDPIIGISTTLDAMFDWLDRAGCCATALPLIFLKNALKGAHLEITWSYEPNASE